MQATPFPSAPASREFAADAARSEAEIRFVLARIDENIARFGSGFPGPYSERNVYREIPNDYWTTSFWTGMIWLAYEVTGAARYRAVAEQHLASFAQRLEQRVATDTHDLGFLYILSSLAGHQLTGEPAAKATAIAAADLLMTRYFERAGIIQAWGNLDDPAERGRMIIDCGMNLPLLYWASRATGDPRYAEAARRHAGQSAAYLVRADASTFHTFYMDTDTGEPRFGRTNQGYSDNSCWARGQAWAIYGFALSFVHTGDPAFIAVAKRVADYFLARLPEDFICYWDLIFTSGGQERDSSAAAIAACGLMELSRHLPLWDPDRVRYETAASAMLRSLANHYTTRLAPGSNGLLLHAVYAKSVNRGVDECCIWGDYFYFEALVRASRSWRPYWCA